MGTDFCSHLGGLFWAYANTKSISACALFLDIIGAFDMVIRDLLYSDDVSDEQIAAILKRLKYGPSVMHDIAAHIAAKPAFDNANVLGHLQALVKEIHTGTWHSTQGLEEVTNTSIGSKPGDPLGDICFNYLVCRILNEVEEEAAKENLVFY